MIRKFNPMLFGMYCIEPSKRFAHRLLVTMISSVDVSSNFVFCLDFGRKEKKADEATEDPRDPKNAKLSCKSAKGLTLVLSSRQTIGAAKFCKDISTNCGMQAEKRSPRVKTRRLS